MSDAIIRDFALERYNTLRLRVTCRLFAEVRSIEELRTALQHARQEGVPVLVLGEGSNVLFRGNFDGMVVKVGLKGVEVQPTDDGARVTACAGENWNELVQACVATGLCGVENLALIPGSVGAAPVQNIGAYGAELAEVFEELEMLDPRTLEVRRMSRAECRFGYRHSAFKEPALAGAVITRVRLRLRSEPRPNLSYAPVREELAAMGVVAPGVREVAEAVMRIRRRRLPDPAVVGNVGSFFKNPVVPVALATELRERYPGLPVNDEGEGCCKLSAAWLIDRCGLRGTAVGDAAVSEQHALVLVNRGQALPQHFLQLAALIQGEVEAAFSVRLELEPTLS